MSEGTISTKPKPFVFVLMPFDNKFSDIYKFGIKGAAEDAGAYAERVDEQIFVEGMLDRIFNQINKADVIVADMTAKNPNVFYEVGYAHALDKVVLLITQSADDIPFDLKHRQHIVYGGKIEVLRSELASRIRWAIVEAERRGSDTVTEKISVRLNGLELPNGIGVSQVPELKGRLQSTIFHLPLLVRNDSEQGLLKISHVYLFSREDAEAVPVESPQNMTMSASEYWGTGGGVTAAGMYGPGIPINVSGYLLGPSKLESFAADPIDAPDGLTKQFPIRTNFGSLPPRATEGMYIAFELKALQCNSTYRLRFHTASSYFDFPFRLALTRAE
jgi:hypothetical protein